jgi:hypothetical protein
MPTPATREMLDIIASIAAYSGVALFRRFEIMRYWHVDRGIPFDQMISNFDGNWLHQNDWTYNCIAEALCDGPHSGPPRMMQIPQFIHPTRRLTSVLRPNKFAISIEGGPRCPRLLPNELPSWAAE